MPVLSSKYFFFFFNDTATTEIYTLSLHDALPIYPVIALDRWDCTIPAYLNELQDVIKADRKSTRLNSSHVSISYAVFCLKKKKNTTNLNFCCKKKRRQNVVT